MAEKIKKKSKKKLIIIISAVLLVLIACGIFGYEYYLHSAYFCQYAKQVSVSEVKGGDKLTLIAHRGLATEAPENTLPAYEKAAEKGFRYAECDIRVSADGVWVVSHDASLKRMTGFDGTIEKMTLKEIRSHKITKGANIEKYPNLVTPTFDEFIKTCVTSGIVPVIEIKTDEKSGAPMPYADIINELKKYNIESSAVIISFNDEALKALRALDISVYMQFLADDITDDTINTALSIGNCGLDIKYQSILKNPAMAKKAIGNDLVLNAWTVDSADKAAELVPTGVSMLTTNAIMP